MYEPHWTSCITALTVPVIAIFAAIIAYRQWRTTQNKLKLDLFEKRMIVYQTARDMLGYVGSHGKISQEEQFKYLTGIQTSKWVFGPDLSNYLHKTLWEKIVDLELYQTMVYEGPKNDPERSKYIKLKAEALKWLVKQFEVLDAKCAKYMILEH